jgi:protease stability complex PrcB-like protein
MNRALLSLFVVLLISIPDLQVLRAAQDYQGRPVPITAMGPKRPGPRTSFTIGGGIWDQLRVVVRDRDAWLDVWKRIHRPDPNRGPYPEPPPLPEIDFSREMIVVAGMGRRPSSAYAIIIDSAYDRNDRLEVVVRSVENRKGCGAFTVMTAPIDIVRLPKTERSVVFREIEVVPDCK